MQYDLVIIGGGLVGTGLAVALRQSGLRIALVDARMPSLDDVRLFALNHSSCQCLENLGVWETLSAHASPIHQVHVSHQGHFGAVRLNREEVNVSSLGHVVPAKYVEQALNDAVVSSDHCTFYRPMMLKQLTQTDTCVEMHLSSLRAQRSKPEDDSRQSPGLLRCARNDGNDGNDGNDDDITIRASIVIGADGAESTVRKQLGIPAKVHDYQQSAIVFKTTLQREHKQIAYERFVKDGAIAMLPLPNKQCASIWSAEKTYSDQLMALSDHEFQQTLQKEFGYRLGRIQAIGKRDQFPLRMLQSDEASSGRVLLLGNALHALHPIAAQGFNLAMQEVAALVDAINENTMQQKPLTDLSLQDISERTRKQRERSITVSHRLSTIFNSKSAWMSVLLQMGMIGFDLATPIKQTFIEGMMGRAGIVPNLLLRANEL